MLFIVQRGDEIYDPDNLTVHRDARMHDLREIVDYLSTYEPKPWGLTDGIEEEWKTRAKKLKGIHLYCREKEPLKYTQTSYPLDYPFNMKTTLPGATGPDTRLEMELMFFGMPINKELDANPNAKEITRHVQIVSK